MYYILTTTSPSYTPRYDEKLNFNASPVSLSSLPAYADIQPTFQTTTHVSGYPKASFNSMSTVYDTEAKALRRDLLEYKKSEITSPKFHYSMSLNTHNYPETTTNAAQKTFSQQGPYKTFEPLTRSPIANVRGDENAPSLTNSCSNSNHSVKHKSFIDLTQMKSDVANIKHELSSLRNDISTSSKNLKEIDVNLVHSNNHTTLQYSTETTKIENTNGVSGESLPTNLPFNQFYKDLNYNRNKNYSNLKGFLDENLRFRYDKPLNEVSPNKENQTGIVDNMTRNEGNWNQFVNGRPALYKMNSS